MTEEERKRVLEIVEQLKEMYLDIQTMECRKQSLTIQITRLEDELNRLKGSHR